MNFKALKQFAIIFSMSILSLDCLAASPFKNLEALPFGKIHTVIVTKNPGEKQSVVEFEICTNSRSSIELDQKMGGDKCTLRVLKDTPTLGSAEVSCSFNGVFQQNVITSEMKSQNRLETSITNIQTGALVNTIQTYLSPCN